MKTQMDWVQAQLTKNKSITRNQALRQYISRLGARIADLRAVGWEIEGGFIKTKFGKDYKYTLIKRPCDK